ncbi:MAG: FtsX-like permease family protein [Phenylobacterium sp.]|nr:MAG: FtsX-like permease family protein [Phenylobacterium sp.]
MFRNYLAAALRNLARNRLYAAVTIAGLAIGFAAAILIGLYVRDELTYDRSIPGHDRVFLVTETLVLTNSKPIESQVTPPMMLRQLQAEFPEIQYAARLSPPGFPANLRHGDFTSSEQTMYWADPDFFRVMPLPTVAGSLADALEPSDGVVLTRSMARKYFGQDAPLGQILQIDGQPFHVTAVIEDLPSNTHLTAEIFASARSPASQIAKYESIDGPLNNTLATYVRLRPGAGVVSMDARTASFLATRLPIPNLAELGSVRRTLHFVPLTKIHLTPSTQGAFKPAADPAVIGAIALVGVLIVVVAAINFVTLMTARAARRAVEVGVRKAAGASRRDLIVQFMGEAFLYVLAAAVLAVSLAELLMPAVDALLQRKLALNYLHDPMLALAIAGALLLTALLAGAYPAFVLSAFRPSLVLKGGPGQSTGGSAVRQALVIGQFAVLVGLVLVAVTIARQTRYALNEGMRLNKDQVLLVFASPCVEPFRDEVRKLPGVRSAACASYEALNLGDNRDAVPVHGQKIDVSVAPVDFGFLETFGIKPIVGRLFDRARPADGMLDNPAANPPVILNESAVRKLGFASPQAALGRIVTWHGIWDDSQRKATFTIPPNRPSEVIGVVPDFTFGSVRQTILPTMYSIGRNLPPNSIALVVKLDGSRTPETLAAIDGLWKHFGGGKPILRVFVDRFTMRLYVDTIIQGATVAIAGIIALTVAALGLFALSAYTTERRTKEIGVRKAMGASSGDILKLLLWQFTKPVIWANLIAWPAAWLILRWWLSSFAYHVDVAPWTFAAAGLGALAIAWATVFVHALSVARAKPVTALRYE